jgi:hypothetical protein
MELMCAGHPPVRFNSRNVAGTKTRSMYLSFRISMTLSISLPAWPSRGRQSASLPSRYAAISSPSERSKFFGSVANSFSWS